MAAKTASKAIEAADVVDDVKELVEDTVELVERKASWIASNPKAAMVTASLVGVAAGAVLGYLIASKRLSAKWQAEADEQIASVKAHYSILRKENITPESLASQYPEKERQADDIVANRILGREGYTPYNKISEDVPVLQAEPVESEEITVTQAIVEATHIVRNVFESDDPTTYFNFDEELKRRNEKPDQAFVITKEEFDMGEADYDQAELTYYDGDDTLADSKDKPVQEVDMVMGYENLLRFGHGSGDPKIVYIRNPKLELDFEVTQSEGKYAKEVLDFDDGDSLKHSDRRPVRKFRSSDE